MRIVLSEAVIDGGHYIVMQGESIQRRPVIWYKLANGSSTKMNLELSEELIVAYKRYLNNVHNPFIVSKKQGMKEIKYIDDFEDNNGISHLYAVGNNVQIASVALHPAATSMANHNLIEEVKNIYAKYASNIKIIK